MGLQISFVLAQGLRVRRHLHRGVGFRVQEYGLRNVFPRVPDHPLVAALGAEVEIPAIGGNVTLKIPEGTPSGKELRVRGKGVPFLNERGSGDLIVKVMVEIPRKLSRIQRELVSQLAESLAVENKPASASLIEKMKDMFN